MRTYNELVEEREVLAEAVRLAYRFNNRRKIDDCRKDIRAIDAEIVANYPEKIIAL